MVRKKGLHRLGLACIALLCLASALLANDSAVKNNPKNQCVVCHTNAKGMIRLSWEVEKVRPKHGISSETSGEG